MGSLPSTDKDDKPGPSIFLLHTPLSFYLFLSHGSLSLSFALRSLSLSLALHFAFSSSLVLSRSSLSPRCSCKSWTIIFSSTLKFPLVFFLMDKCTETHSQPVLQQENERFGSNSCYMTKAKLLGNALVVISR